MSREPCKNLTIDKIDDDFIYFFARQRYYVIYKRVTDPTTRYAQYYYGLPICSEWKFIVFAMNDPNLRRLISEYSFKVGNDRMKFTPTVDRKIRELGYIEGNMSFITQSENSLKAKKDCPKYTLYMRRPKGFVHSTREAKHIEPVEVKVAEPIKQYRNGTLFNLEYMETVFKLLDDDYKKRHPYETK